ncbi:MAG: extracellular solute-binding protein, partial [Candidatus Eremiobacteraeota bacterium]|nr:extracellular solute-binding protein [Candidatus Eremiobacteraeota bacterium]
MSHFDRRRFLELSAAGVAGAAATTAMPEIVEAAAAGMSPFKPEKGASLQLLRWSEFVKNDHVVWEENTKKFTEKTGVPVQIQWLSWPDVSPKSALSAQVNSGADITMGFYNDPFLYPEKLVDVSDVVTWLSHAHGGFFDVAKTYAYHEGLKHWIGVPIGVPGNAMNFRKDWMEQAGFSSFPEDTDGMLKLAQAMKKQGHPCGFTLGHAVSDGNGWTDWIFWGYGAKQVNPDNTPAINSEATLACIDYVRQLYETEIDGVASWGDPSNNQAFLAGKIGLTMNGISIWYVAKDQFPQVAQAMDHAIPGYGPIKVRTLFNTFTQAFIWKYSKYPNAAKEYIRFMMDSEQAAPWVAGMRGYVTPALRAYTKLPIWTSDPKITPFRDVLVGERFDGYAGSPGKGAAQTMDAFVLV